MTAGGARVELPTYDPQSYGAVCATVDGCLVCGDVAVPVTVIEPGEADALCEDEHGARGAVGVELVVPVTEGDRLLVHGGVAISRLAPDRASDSPERSDRPHDRLKGSDRPHDRAERRESA